MHFIKNVEFGMVQKLDSQVRSKCANIVVIFKNAVEKDYLLPKFGFDAAENEPYYFVSSSSREFEFEL